MDFHQKELYQSKIEIVLGTDKALLGPLDYSKGLKVYQMVLY